MANGEFLTTLSSRSRPHILLFVLTLACSITSHSQKIAVLTPDKAAASIAYSERLEEGLSSAHNVLDDSLAEAAYNSAAPKTPFNLTADESKRIGTVIGCDFFIVLRSATQRRSSFKTTAYYEAYAAVYVVSRRTGRLVHWQLPSFEAGTAEAAQKLLHENAAALAADISKAVRAAAKSELAEPDPPEIGSVPESDSPDAKNFRAPIPYRRIKPEYTPQAALYEVAASVEIEVDTDADGTITRTEIVRWAGFGLDRSVERAVRSMNWRPAERNGKPLPMRFLLRYNFKKLDKEQPPTE